MEIQELKKLAQERELSAISKKALKTISVLESKTGRLVGIYHSTEEAVEAIMEYPVVEPVKPVAVKWTSIAQVTAPPLRCPNDYGPNCMCLDKTFVYLCAVQSCPNKAECNGTCRGHFSQLRKFGDLTQAAVRKTDQFHAEGGEKLRIFPAVLPLKMVKPTNRDWGTFTPGEILQATGGVVGMTVKYTGTEFVLLDKDGHVVGRTESKSDLLEDDSLEDEV